MLVRRFRADTDSDLWNHFVASGKNKTFLFDRAFMDYHAERFTDFSLLIFDDATLIALLPATIVKRDGDVIISHAGLTYGGLIVKQDIKLETVLFTFHALLKYLFENKINFLQLKNFPTFYNTHATDEVDYIMFLLEAKLFRRDIALVIDLQHKIQYSGNIRREANKAEKVGAKVQEDNDMILFWKEILIPNLKERFGVSPVHSAEEINLLKKRFPQNIRQFNVYLNEMIVAGTTLFIDNGVVHCQYISADEEGRKTGSLNFLFKYLIDFAFSDYRYFDFGIVNEDNGQKLNKGMLFWKESFGGRAMKHDFYRINTESYKKLEIHLQ